MLELNKRSPQAMCSSIPSDLICQSMATTNTLNPAEIEDHIQIAIAHASAAGLINHIALDFKANFKP